MCILNRSNTNYLGFKQVDMYRYRFCYMPMQSKVSFSSIVRKIKSKPASFETKICSGKPIHSILENKLMLRDRKVPQIIRSPILRQIITS